MVDCDVRQVKKAFQRVNNVAKKLTRWTTDAQYTVVKLARWTTDAQYTVVES
jgi:hypothetical protein